MSHKLRTIDEYITLLERFQSKLKEMDHDYSDKIMYAIRDKVTTLIICRYTPEYKFTKSIHAREYVINILTEPLYNKLEIYDSHWKRMFNEHIDTYNKHPYKYWVSLREFIRSNYASSSHLQSQRRDTEIQV